MTMATVSAVSLLPRAHRREGVLLLLANATLFDRAEGTLGELLELLVFVRPLIVLDPVCRWCL